MDVRRALRIAAVAATAGLLLVLAVVLSQSEHHRTGTNGEPPVTEVELAGGAELCQAGERLPEETGRIVIHPDDDGGAVGPLAVRVLSAEGEELGIGRAPRRDYESDASAAVEFEPLRQEEAGASVCVRNEGEIATALRGDAAPIPDRAARPSGDSDPAPSPYVRMRFDYELPDASTWWSFAPEMAERFGLVKATFFGTWTMWLTVAALLALAFATIWYAARTLAR